jgi:hypothetical protein
MNERSAKLFLRPRILFIYNNFKKSTVENQFDEDAADDRARLESDLPAVPGPVPVRHRNAVGRLVEEVENGIDQGREISGPARECGRS